MHSLILNLLIFLFVPCFHVIVLVSAKVFLSIDCGYTSPEPYTDSRSIEWVGDQQYTQTGESRNVVASSSDRIWSTVREFTTRKKNCYSLDVFNNKFADGTKVERVLVRASFYYNNYDNEATPPTFNLQFNGNNWSQVVTSMGYTTFEEVVFSLNHGTNISVCLVQTQRGHFPFITALEVRSLDLDMYSYVDSNHPLIFKGRIQYATTEFVRFPEDRYDRLWVSPSISNTSALVRVSNTWPTIKVDIADKVPESIFTGAMILTSISRRISLFGDTKKFAPMNFNAYFSEVVELNSKQKRSIDITCYIYDDIGGPFYNQKFGPVIPPYGDVLQFRIHNVTVHYKKKVH